jgi:hypothetical protein
VTAQRLEFELEAEPDLAGIISAEFGDSIRIPAAVTVSILASLGAELLSKAQSLARETV